MNTNHVELDLYVGNLDPILWSSRIDSISLLVRPQGRHSNPTDPYLRGNKKATKSTKSIKVSNALCQEYHGDQFGTLGILIAQVFAELQLIY